MKKATVQTLDLPENRRILAISDVHGNLPLFRTLLETAKFSIQDILFVVGDLLEKGEESLSTLRYVMDLSRRYTLYPINGNCDDLVTGFVDGREELPESFFRYYLGTFRERCTLVQMGHEAGLTPREMEDYSYFRSVLREQFRPEFDFLRSFPTIINTPNLLFVHGGVPSDQNMEELDAWSCMKNDNYAEQSPQLSKWCIVGHTPTTLYRPAIPSCDPFISPEKKIVSIDGGCSIKPDGQLNLLTLSSCDASVFPFLQGDALPTVTAFDAQAASSVSLNIRWGHNQVERLEEGVEFSRCRHVETGYTLDILTDFLYEKEGALYAKDVTDYRLPVTPGDVLSLVRRTSRGLLAKKSGVTGWYGGRFLLVQPPLK